MSEPIAASGPFDEALASLAAPVRDFGSDNRAPMCPRGLEELVRAAGVPRADSYGGDQWTARAGDGIRALFGRDELEVVWTPTGTAANVVAVGSCRPGPAAAVLCAEDAHVRVDEAGALQRAWGTPLVPVASPQGKLTAEAVEEVAEALAANHPYSPDPAVVMVTQASESGRVYGLDEIAGLCEVAARHGAEVVIDGARFANALAKRPELSSVFDTGVSAVVVGGTKNGLGTAEAVVLADAAHGHLARRAAKQLGHCASKSRFVCAPAAGCLSAGCFVSHARRANDHATRLAARLEGVGVGLWRPVEANLVFAHLDDGAIEALDRWCHVSAWAPGVVRLACAFDHTDSDIDRLAAGVEALVGATR